MPPRGRAPPNAAGHAPEHAAGHAAPSPRLNTPPEREKPCQNPFGI